MKSLIVLLSLTLAGMEAAHAEDSGEQPCAAAHAALPDAPEAALAALDGASPGAGCAGGETEAALLRSYAEQIAGAGKSRSVSSLKKSLKRYDDSGGAPSRLVGLVLTAIAERQLAERNERAFETAGRAEAVLAATAPNDLPSRAKSVLQQAAARLLKQPNFSSDVVDAFNDASRARALLSGALTEHDPAYLSAVAWQAAILGVAASDRRVSIDQSVAAKALAVLSPSGCDASWKREELASVRRELSWSGSLMGARRFLGAVAVVELDADGAPVLKSVASEARLPALTTLPEAAIRWRDKAASTALGRWTLDASAPPECRGPTLIPFGSYVPDPGDASGVLRELPQNYQSSTE